ncbi:MAG TPA: Gfo/Idh/MocA family oxidoreductase [Planctomycetota bacterium]
MIGTLAAPLSVRLLAGDEPARRMRAAIIGRTGKGNFGHGMDVCFNREDVEVVAVADPDSAGRARAAERSKAPRQYESYREMLEKEKPQLVSVAPRWSEEHHAMVLAALQAGAHVYCEKPFTVTPAEADELVALADKSKLKIAVAHQMRLSPNVVHLKKKIDEGLIGELKTIHAHGKQDSRAGGEDLLVLGVHLFNLMSFLAGPALTCKAEVLQQGRRITVADARRVAEGIGPVAGDDISAEFVLEKGVTASFISAAKNRGTAPPWGLELIGSKGIAKIAANIPCQTFVKTAVGEWEAVPGDPMAGASAEKDAFGAANRRMVDDLLAAIREDRQPASSGRDALKTIEMVMAVYRSALSGAAVKLPLEKRGHALVGE